MTYEAWRISHQSSEQAARAAYAQLHAVSAAARSLADATCESEAEAAINAIETATGEGQTTITENIIQSFLVGYNTHPNQNEFLNINSYFDWWKAKRRHKGSQQAHTQ